MASHRSFLRDVVKSVVTRFGGPKLYEKLQAKAMIQNLDRRLVDEPETHLLSYFVKDGDTVIDVGANYLYYSILLARLTPKGAVHAFEPVPFTFRVAGRMHAHYSEPSLELHNYGVGNTNETVIFKLPKQPTGGVAAGTAHMGARDNEVVRKNAVYPYSFTKHEEVPAKIVRLDDYLLPQLPEDAQVSFVKIDIEGAELFALQGMQQLLERYQPNILVEVVEAYLNGFGVKGAEIYSLLSGLGYTLYSYNETSQKLVQTPTFDQERNYIALHAHYQDRLAELLA